MFHLICFYVLGKNGKLHVGNIEMTPDPPVKGRPLNIKAEFSVGMFNPFLC